MVKKWVIQHYQNCTGQNKKKNCVFKHLVALIHVPHLAFLNVDIFDFVLVRNGALKPPAYSRSYH